MTLETVDLAALQNGVEPVAERRAFVSSDGRFTPYFRECLEEPPEFAAVGGDARVVATGSAHDFEGRLRKNSPEVIEVLTGLQRKVDAHADELAFVRADLDDGARTLVVSYGVSARAALQACRAARAGGTRVSYLQLQTLFPLAATALAEALEGVERVVVVEENLAGLYAGVLEPHLDSRELVRVNAIGAMIPPSRIEVALA